MARARRTTTRTTRTAATTAATSKSSKAPAKKVAPATPEKVPVKNALPFIELKYAVKNQDNYYGGAIPDNIKVFHTGTNELTLVQGNHRTKFHIDKLLALVGAATGLTVGTPER